MVEEDRCVGVLRGMLGAFVMGIKVDKRKASFDGDDVT